MLGFASTWICSSETLKVSEVKEITMIIKVQASIHAKFLGYDAKTKSFYVEVDEETRHVLSCQVKESSTLEEFSEDNTRSRSDILVTSYGSVWAIKSLG